MTPEEYKEWLYKMMHVEIDILFDNATAKGLDMGLYTELLLKCQVDDRDPNVKAVLNHLFNGHENPEILPDHPHFKKEKWAYVSGSSSAYHIEVPFSYYKHGTIFSRSDFKNYDKEIESFLMWLYPYFSNYEDELVLGWIWVEEEVRPRLITKIMIKQWIDKKDE